MNKKIVILLTCLILTFSFSICVNAQTEIKGKWYETPFREGIQKGWISSSNGKYYPEKPITRAEFIKALEKAIKLTPNSEVLELLKQNSLRLTKMPFTDISDHWFYKEGYFRSAYIFGLIDSGDYNNKFMPDKPITRNECAVILSRALGLVYPATSETASVTNYSDKLKIPTWSKGYIKQTTDKNLFVGYPNKSFGAQRVTTKAEAITMISRAVREMEIGIDRDIKVNIGYFKWAPNVTPEPPQTAKLVVPAVVINNIIYLPAHSLYMAANVRNLTWNPIKQILWFELGVSQEYQAGNKHYGFYTGIHKYSPTFSVPPRILYGELMIPVYDPSLEQQINTSIINHKWDPKTKTLDIIVYEVQHPVS